MKKIVFVFTYISPEYSPIYRNKDETGIDLLWSKLEEICTVYPDASLFLAGNMNARTKNFNDFIPQNDFTAFFN